MVNNIYTTYLHPFPSVIPPLEWKRSFSLQVSCQHGCPDRVAAEFCGSLVDLGQSIDHFLLTALPTA